MRTKTKILIEALRILARDIQSEDGVANAAIAEAADRMEEMYGGYSDLAFRDGDSYWFRSALDRFDSEEGAIEDYIENWDK